MMNSKNGTQIMALIFAVSIILAAINNGNLDMNQIYPTEQRYNSLQHVFGDRWDGSQLALGQDLNNWRGADLYNLSCKDQTDFMTYKEAQYDIRRQRVKSLCKQIKGFPRNKEIYHEMTRLRAFLFKYSQRDKVAYCHIAKVASSTWSSHFVDLATQEELKHHQHGTDHKKAFEIFRLPSLNPSSVVSAFKKATSIFIVRHPFSRIASVYYDKVMDGNRLRRSWKGPLLRDHNQLGRDPNSTVEQALQLNPEWFVVYLIQHSHRDDHWSPQSFQCPICSVNFTIYARLEDIYEDTAYFLLKTNLTNRIRHTLHERKTNTSMESHETKFWKNVRPSNIAGLFAAYRMDFELFGYDPAKYFSQIGLSQKTEEVDMRIREKIAEDSGDPFT